MPGYPHSVPPEQGLAFIFYCVVDGRYAWVGIGPNQAGPPARAASRVRHNEAPKRSFWPSIIPGAPWLPISSPSVLSSRRAAIEKSWIQNSFSSNSRRAFIINFRVQVRHGLNGWRRVGGKRRKAAAKTMTSQQAPIRNTNRTQALRLLS